MTTFQYGMAYYNDGVLEAHGGEMPDMTGSEQSLAPFLREAGEKGWEFCGLLPVKSDHYQAFAIFKRPVE